MQKEFFEKLVDLSNKEEPFAVATVVHIQGSSSAKPGSKAIIDAHERLLFGWMGGGCAESTVRYEASQSIKDGNTRMITIDMTDEVLGVGMPCGGTMQVYIEPVLPKPKLVIIGHGKIAETIAAIGKMMNFTVTVNSPAATPEAFPTADKLVQGSFGETKIDSQSYVVIATQHKQDHLSLQRALEGNAAYIALIASKKRAKLVLDYVRDAGVSPSKLSHVRTPAGLNLGALTPEEIALSVMSEIIAVRRGGSGRPIHDMTETEASDSHTVQAQVNRVVDTCGSDEAA